LHHMAIVFHERYFDHVQYEGHPESPERLAVPIKRMLELDLWRDVTRPEPACEEDILLAHTPHHFAAIKDSPEGFLDPDTYIHKDTFEIALLAAGGTIEAARTAHDFGKPTLALVRPPGHHAGRDFCGGFCYFNNIAIAARKMDLERAAIVDIDVHHGNGTEDIFIEDDKVLFMSTHQRGIYPGSGDAGTVGRGKGEGYTVNIPMRGGIGDATYMMIFDRIIEPILHQYDPQMILVSIGVDAHYADPLASLALSSKAYLEMCKRLINMAPEKRIAFALEGGYALEATAEVLSALAGEFCGVEVPLCQIYSKDVEVLGKEEVESVIEIQKEYWDL
jgi:acetoin utilization deacetylase AcuC-like enzyme